MLLCTAGRGDPAKRQRAAVARLGAEWFTPITASVADNTWGMSLPAGPFLVLPQAEFISLQCLPNGRNMYKTSPGPILTSRTGTLTDDLIGLPQNLHPKAGIGP